MSKSVIGSMFRCEHCKRWTLTPWRHVGCNPISPQAVPLERCERSPDGQHDYGTDFGCRWCPHVMTMDGESR